MGGAIRCGWCGSKEVICVDKNTVYCYRCYRETRSFKNNHKVVPTLNGNNGEATNSDDVKLKLCVAIPCNINKHYHLKKKKAPVEMNGAARRIATKQKKMMADKKEVVLCTNPNCEEESHYHEENLDDDMVVSDKVYCGEATTANSKPDSIVEEDLSPAEQYLAELKRSDKGKYKRQQAKVDKNRKRRDTDSLLNKPRTFLNNRLISTEEIRKTPLGSVGKRDFEARWNEEEAGYMTDETEILDTPDSSSSKGEPSEILVPPDGDDLLNYAASCKKPTLKEYIDWIDKNEELSQEWRTGWLREEKSYPFTKGDMLKYIAAKTNRRLLNDDLHDVQMSYEVRRQYMISQVYGQEDSFGKIVKCANPVVVAQYTALLNVEQTLDVVGNAMIAIAKTKGQLDPRNIFAEERLTGGADVVSPMHDVDIGLLVNLTPTARPHYENAVAPGYGYIVNRDVGKPGYEPQDVTVYEHTPGSEDGELRPVDSLYSLTYKLRERNDAVIDVEGFMHRNDIVVYNPVGDGRCLFRAVAVSLFSDESLYDRIRDVAVRVHNKTGNARGHILASSPHAWGTEEDLIALCQVEWPIHTAGGVHERYLTVCVWTPENLNGAHNVIRCSRNIGAHWVVHVLLWRDHFYTLFFKEDMLSVGGYKLLESPESKGVRGVLIPDPIVPEVEDVATTKDEHGTPCKSPSHAIGDKPKDATPPVEDPVEHDTLISVEVYTSDIFDETSPLRNKLLTWVYDWFSTGRDMAASHSNGNGMLSSVNISREETRTPGWLLRVFGFSEWSRRSDGYWRPKTGLYTHSRKVMVFADLAQLLISDKIQNAFFKIMENNPLKSEGYQTLVRSLFAQVKSIDDKLPEPYYWKINHINTTVDTVSYAINTIGMAQWKTFPSIPRQVTPSIITKRAKKTRLTGGYAAFSVPALGTGVYNFGDIYMCPTVMPVNKAFTFNDRFKLLRGFKKDHLSFKIDREFMIDDPDGRDCFGPTMAHNGIIHKNHPVSLYFAERRHLSCREASRAGFDAKLRLNQKESVATHYTLFKHIFGQLGPSNYCTDVEQDAYSLTILPHPKKELRKQCYDELMQSQRLGLVDWCKETNGKEEKWCVHKLKRAEIAKYAKYGRIIVDLAVGRSLQGAIWTEVTKSWLSAISITYNNCKYMFVKSTDPIVISHVYNEMYTTEHKLYYTVFSDDSVLSYYENGQRHWYNLDISGNDTSHTPDMFRLFFEITGCNDDLKERFDNQIMLPIRIDNVHTPALPKTQGVAFAAPKMQYLQSGSTLTTVLNSFVNITIGIIMTIMDLDYSDPVNIEKAWNCHGYIPDITKCTYFQDLQFLKTSPVLDINGEWKAVMNVGPIFRASGTCKGKLPGKDRRRDSANFQNLLINGFTAPYTCDFYKLLMRKEGKIFVDKKIVNKVHSDFDFKFNGVKQAFDDGYRAIFSTEELLFRYIRHDMGAYEEFKTLMQTATYNSIICCTFVDIVMNVDYGFDPHSPSEVPWYTLEEYLESTNEWKSLCNVTNTNELNSKFL